MLTRDQINEIMDIGTKAYYNGKSTNDNPFSKFSEKGRLWLRGYINTQWAAKWQNNCSRPS